MQCGAAFLDSFEGKSESFARERRVTIRNCKTNRCIRSHAMKAPRKNMRKVSNELTSTNVENEKAARLSRKVSSFVRAYFLDANVLYSPRDRSVAWAPNLLNRSFCGELNVSRRGLHSCTELEI
jgi:hypothetical protein